MDCPHCLRFDLPVATARCPNCGGEIPRGAVEVAAPEPAPDPAAEAAPELGGLATLRGILSATGAPAEDVAAADPSRLVAGLLDLTRGYETDPAAIVAEAAEDEAPGDGVTLSAETRVRMACARCCLPVLGEVRVRWRGALQPSAVVRIVECLSLRLQTEAGLAEQTVAAVVDVARAAEAEAVVEARRPCGGCGAGQVVTQARARRVAPAGGDPPQQCGDRLPLG